MLDPGGGGGSVYTGLTPKYIVVNITAHLGASSKSANTAQSSKVQGSQPTQADTGAYAGIFDPVLAAWFGGEIT